MIAESGPSALSRAKADALSLVDMGVPLVAGPLTDGGDPSGPRWNGWERTRPNKRPVDRWQPGEGLGALTGKVFDVIDVDPRNGGMESLALMAEALGDDGPDEYWRVATSSGGRHIYIAPLGLGGHNKFLPGLDLKANGGFVFIPPTVRPSKDPRNAGTMVAYHALTDLVAPIGRDTTGAHLRDFITECLANRAGGSRLGGGRRAVSALEQACLDADDGGQREALLDLVTELSRASDDDEYVLWRTMKVVAGMTNFDPRRPWKEADVRGLLYSNGRRPVADASGSELDDLAAMKGDGPMVREAVSGLVPLSKTTREKIRWLWYRYLAFGDASLIDSFAGVGKSLTALDLVARATRGRGMPGESEVLSGPLNVLLLAPEDRASVQLARVEAAGGDPSRVFIPSGIEVRSVPGKRGKQKKERAYLGGHLITFPASVERFHQWIKAHDIGLVVIDPIAAFLDQDINSNNDASVRRALEPFVTILAMEGCAAWLIRHFNKDSKQAASMRGGGSVAFGAVARTHMVAGELPDWVTGNDAAGPTHAICLVKTNNVRRKRGVALAYSIEDSDIAADDIGTFVPRIEWHGEMNVDVEELAGKQRKGPAPTAQPKWSDLLEAMFAEKDTWLVSDIRARAEGAGLSWDNHVYDKVKDRMGISPVSEGKRGGGKRHYWTTRKVRVGRSSLYRLPPLPT